MGHKDLRLGKIVYILVFYNISFSWLLSLDGFQYIFLVRDSRVTVKTIYLSELAGQTDQFVNGTSYLFKDLFLRSIKIVHAIY